jgi:hypothetical protein
MHTSNYSRNRNYSNKISSSQHRQSNNLRTGFTSTSSNSEEIFQYKGSNKQQWTKLQNKIKQKMMAQNIWYLEDKDEVARRSTPAPPISTIPPLPSETPNQREDRLRLQKLYDDHRRKRESKFEDYEEQFALDYGKAIAVHYHFLSPTLQLDLDRAIEGIDPPTTNVAIHYRVLKTHLANKWGPNSVKDSNEATSKLALLRVDERGADVYLAAVFSIIDLLTKTPIRDAAKNPIMEAVPPRPHLPRPLAMADPAEHTAYIAADEAAVNLWALQHPNNKIKTTTPPTTTSRTRLSSHSRHPPLRTTQASPTSTNKLTTPPAPGQTYAKTSNPASKTRQGEHHGIHRLSRAEHAPTIPTGPPLSAHPPHPTRTATPAKKNKKTTNTETTTPLATHREYKRNRDDDRRSQPYPQEVRSASPATTIPAPNNKYPCANCNADHKTIDCDSTKCGLCEATFPTASQRNAHYHTYHRNEQPSKRTPFNLPRQQRHF